MQIESKFNISTIIAKRYKIVRTERKPRIKIILEDGEVKYLPIKPAQAKTKIKTIIFDEKIGE